MINNDEDDDDSGTPFIAAIAHAAGADNETTDDDDDDLNEEYNKLTNEAIDFAYQHTSSHPSQLTSSKDINNSEEIECYLASLIDLPFCFNRDNKKFSKC
jgi:hypothetical protein